MPPESSEPVNIAVTGYGAWLGQDLGAEAFWNVATGLEPYQPFVKGPGAPMMGRIFNEILFEALERSGLRCRSHEGRKITLFIGGAGLGSKSGPAQFLMQLYHYFAAIDEHAVDGSPKLAATLLERSLESLIRGATDVAMLCILNPAESTGPGAVLLVLEREEDAIRERVPIAALINTSAFPPAEKNSVTADYVGLYGRAAFPENAADALSPGSAPASHFSKARILEHIAAPGSVDHLAHPLAPILKTLLAVERGIFPPTIAEGSLPPTFRRSSMVQPWFGHGAKCLRCAAMFMGEDQGSTPFTGWFLGKGSPRVAGFRHGPELFVFSAADSPALMERLEAVLADTANPAFRPATLAADKPLAWRAAVVAKNLTELADGVSKLLTKIRRDPEAGFALRNQWFYSGPPGRTDQEKLAILFPGQGSQFLNMNQDILLRFARYREEIESWNVGESVAGERPVAEWVFPDQATSTAEEKKNAYENILTFENGGVAGFVSSLAMYRLLKSLGVRSDCMVGNSNGEHSALMAADVVRDTKQQNALDFMRLLRTAMLAQVADKRLPDGVMLVVTVNSRQALSKLLADLPGKVFIALDNCPRQVVLFVVREAIDLVVKEIQAATGSVMPLPYVRPVHTPLLAHISDSFHAIYASLETGLGEIPVYSCVTAAPYPSDRDSILAITTKLWESPVLFRQVTEKLYADGFRLFVEAGPGSRLAGYVSDTLRGKPHCAVSVSSESRSSVGQLLGVLGLLFVRDRWNPRRLYPDGRRAVKPATVIAPPPTAQVPAASPVTVTPEPKPIVKVRAPQANPTIRSGLVDLHIALMSEFLESQQRIGNGVGNFFRTGLMSFAPASLHREVGPATPLENVRNNASGYLTNCRHEGSTTVWDCELRVDKNLFLSDHTYGGKVSDLRPKLTPLPFVPLAYSMEITLQAALAIGGGPAFPVKFANSRGLRWITAERGIIRLKVVAEPVAPLPGERFACKIRIEEPSEKKWAIVMFETEVRFLQAAEPLSSSLPQNLDGPTEWTAADFNQLVLFHGESLQILHHVRSCGQKHVAVELLDRKLDAAHDTPLLPVALVDALSQIGAYWLTEALGMGAFGVFPVRIGELILHQRPNQPGQPCVCNAVFHKIDRDLHGDLEMSGPDGQVFMAAHGLQMRIFPFASRFLATILWHRPELEFSAPLAPPVPPDVVLRHIDLLNHPYLEEGGDMWSRCLAFIMLGAEERDFWLKMPGNRQRKVEWLLGRIAAKDAVRECVRRVLRKPFYPADIEILPDPRGMPVVHCRELKDAGFVPRVSITHSDGMVIAAAAEGGELLGVDFECIGRRKKSNLLETAFRPEEIALLEPGPEHLLAAWVCKEAAAKAAGVGLGGDPLQWRLSSAAGSHWQVESATGKFSVALRRLPEGWVGIARGAVTGLSEIVPVIPDPGSPPAA